MLSLLLFLFFIIIYYLLLYYYKYYYYYLLYYIILLWLLLLSPVCPRVRRKDAAGPSVDADGERVDARGSGTEQIFMITHRLARQNKNMELQSFNGGGVGDDGDEQYVPGANAAGYGSSSSRVTQAVKAFASCNTFVRSKRGYTLILLLTTICLFADQNIMAPNLSQIAEEFGVVTKSVTLGLVETYQSLSS